MSSSFRVKKYFIDTSFGFVGDELVGALLEGQADVDPEGVVGAGPLEAGGHDPRPGAGHRRPAVGGEQGGQVAGLGVEGVGRAGCGPSRTW